MRTEIGLEPCDNQTKCDEPSHQSHYSGLVIDDRTPKEPWTDGVPAETLILDRRFYSSPYIEGFVKFVLQRTHKFGKTKYGKRHIDLLDFFRHAFRPHIYTIRDQVYLREADKPPEDRYSTPQQPEQYEQHMRFVFDISTYQVKYLKV